MGFEQRPRGRPKSKADPHVEASNRIIGRTVHSLLMRGFALRTRGEAAGVAECVGEQAKEMLQRTCPAGKPLGPDQIENIFEAWAKVEREERRLAKRWPLPMPSWYKKESLSQGRSTSSNKLHSLVRELLKNGGNERRGLSGTMGDMEWTPSREKFFGGSFRFEGATYDLASRSLGNEISDEAWIFAQQLLPESKAPGRPRKWSERDILNAIAYRQKNNCAWRDLPRVFPPWKTVHDTYLRWRAAGILEHLLINVPTFPDKDGKRGN